VKGEGTFKGLCYSPSLAEGTFKECYYSPSSGGRGLGGKMEIPIRLNYDIYDTLKN
jgi:hypothetical protein